MIYAQRAMDSLIQEIQNKVDSYENNDQVFLVKSKLLEASSMFQVFFLFYFEKFYIFSLNFKTLHREKITVK